MISMFGSQLAPFSYYKDRYALSLLKWAVGEGATVRSLKVGPLARLLEKPLIKEICAQHSRITPAVLDSVAGNSSLRLSRYLQTWGSERWDGEQTTRPGTNLVLRLDFPEDFVAESCRWGMGFVMSELRRRNHMQEGDGFNLAWCRIDFDWETGEALIEEIQTDWLRNSKSMMLGVSPWDFDTNAEYFRFQLKRDFRFKEYCDERLAPLEAIWSEAMLCATLEFLRDELGFCTIYMHSGAAGAQLKGISWGLKPPVSLYQDLPRKFGFQQTHEIPAFLSRSWGQMGRHRQSQLRGRLATKPVFWKLCFW